jgi:hypothetical protein
VEFFDPFFLDHQEVEIFIKSLPSFFVLFFAFLSSGGSYTAEENILFWGEKTCSGSSSNLFHINCFAMEELSDEDSVIDRLTSLVVGLEEECHLDSPVPRNFWKSSGSPPPDRSSDIPTLTNNLNNRGTFLDVLKTRGGLFFDSLFENSQSSCVVIKGFLEIRGHPSDTLHIISREVIGRGYDLNPCRVPATAEDLPEYIVRRKILTTFEERSQLAAWDPNNTFVKNLNSLEGREVKVPD